MRKKRSSVLPLLVALLVILFISVASYWLMLPPAERRQWQAAVASRFRIGKSGLAAATEMFSSGPSNVRMAPPAPFVITGEPSLAGATGKHRYLEPDAVLKYKTALGLKIRLDKFIDVEASDTGNIYALNRSNLHVYVFSKDLRPLDNWPLQLSTEEFLDRPVAFSIWKQIVVVAAEDGTVARWQSDGTLLNTFELQAKLSDVGVFANGDLILVTPGQDYLLHRTTPEGKEILAFAYRDSADSPTAKIFDSAIVAVLPNDGVTVSYVSTYHLEFYDTHGRPLNSMKHSLALSLSPPEIERDAQGMIKRIFRQVVSYDLKLGADGSLYHLVRIRGAEGGDQWDVFSPAGEYLQRFYLPFNQKSLCFANGAVYVLGAYPNVKLQQYYIEDLTEASQLDAEWQERLKQ